MIATKLYCSLFLTLLFLTHSFASELPPPLECQGQALQTLKSCIHVNSSFIFKYHPPINITNKTSLFLKKISTLLAKVNVDKTYIDAVRSLLSDYQFPNKISKTFSSQLLIEKLIKSFDLYKLSFFEVKQIIDLNYSSLTHSQYQKYVSELKLKALTQIRESFNKNKKPFEKDIPSLEKIKNDYKLFASAFVQIIQTEDLSTLSTELKEILLQFSDLYEEISDAAFHDKTQEPKFILSGLQDSFRKINLPEQLF